MSITNLTNTMFSGISFQRLRKIEAILPKNVEFPGLKRAVVDSLDFVLPPILLLTIADEKNKEHQQKFTYSDLLLLASFDEVFPEEFGLLLDIQTSLNVAEKDRFISEIFVVVSRFMLHYSPTGVEVYQSLKNVDLSCSILWHRFGLRWSTWKAIISDNKNAPPYVSSLLIALLRVRQLTMCYPPFANEINKFAYGAKRFDGAIQSTFFSKENIEWSAQQLNKLYNSVTYNEETVNECSLPMSKDAIQSLTASIAITDKKGSTLTLDVFDIMQCNIFIELPPSLESYEQVDVDMFKIEALKAITWPFFLAGMANKVDAAFILEAFGISKHNVYNQGIPKALDYFRDVDTEPVAVPPAIFTSAMILIWDAKGTFSPKLPK
jgi:hypothetical protein